MPLSQGDLTQLHGDLGIGSDTLLVERLPVDADVGSRDIPKEVNCVIERDAIEANLWKGLRQLPLNDAG